MAERTVVSEFEARRVQRMLRDLYGARLRRDEAFRVEGGVEGEWLSVRWELADAGRTRVYPVEARVDLRRQRLREREAVDLLYDLLGHFFGDHLADPDRAPFTGPNWEAVDFAGREVFLRGQVRDDRAEVLGSALLDADAPARSQALVDAAAGESDEATDQADDEADDEGGDGPPWHEDDGGAGRAP